MLLECADRSHPTVSRPDGQDSNFRRDHRNEYLAATGCRYRDHPTGRCNDFDRGDLAFEDLSLGRAGRCIRALWHCACLGTHVRGQLHHSLVRCGDGLVCIDDRSSDKRPEDRPGQIAFDGLLFPCVQFDALDLVVLVLQLLTGQGLVTRLDLVDHGWRRTSRSDDGDCGGHKDVSHGGAHDRGTTGSTVIDARRATGAARHGAAPCPRIEGCTVIAARGACGPVDGRHLGEWQGITVHPQWPLADTTSWTCRQSIRAECIAVRQ